ncbi:RNA polymerase sigma-70 factor [Pedobacter gandavensis]|uniref:RNA polymerase sigma-70 factor n=1 Tax=Pedobacter gandavensis TaxID=2679963 RepID=UPI00292F19D3|nr:RNA polymerase sigma-70 factor [Pedobacter gandavensis]
MNLSILTDDELIVLFKHGSESAFKEIYSRYWKGVFQVAFKKVHHKELAEELSQNLFVALWNKRERVEISSISNYLFGSLKYSIINHYKSQLVRTKYQDHLKLQKIDQVDNTDYLLMLNELREALNEGIARLPKKTGEVFKLSRMEHYSVKDISRELNISEKAVEYHITQSLKSMRFHLKDYLFLAVFSTLFL